MVAAAVFWVPITIHHPHSATVRTNPSARSTSSDLLRPVSTPFSLLRQTRYQSLPQHRKNSLDWDPGRLRPPGIYFSPSSRNKLRAWVCCDPLVSLCYFHCQREMFRCVRPSMLAIWNLIAHWAKHWHLIKTMITAIGYKTLQNRPEYECGADGLHPSSTH